MREEPKVDLFQIIEPGKDGYAVEAVCVVVRTGRGASVCIPRSCRAPRGPALPHCG